MKKTTRRDFIKAGAAGLTAITILSGTADAAGVELEEATVASLQAQMKAGTLTSRQLVEAYIKRIGEIDPKVRSVVEINPDALAIADKLDAERKKGKVRGPLHGIPVLIKDNIDTADKMKTTAGSLALVGAPTPKQDAFVAKRLRAAGAVIIGKTNLSEWANFRSTKSISGWSGRGGQTNNPYFLDQNPCGSSAGTGAAISSNLATIGIGTETNGSIICPATRNGIVGIKPTLGLVSRFGIIPIAHTQDTAGPMCRSVADAAALLSAIVGTDKSDAITSAAKNAPRDYTKFLDPNALKGARIGVVRQYLGNNPLAKLLFEKQVEVLKSAGAVLVESKFEFDYSKQGDDRLSILLYEFKTDLNKYLAARGSEYKTLADLIRFNDANKEKSMPLFGQELFTMAQAKGELTDKDYLDTLARIKKAAQADGIDAVVAKDNLDAIFSPASGAAWSIAAVAGYPFITVPAGFIQGMPSGVGFFGKAFTEPKLIAIAYAFEQLTKARQKPEFIANLPKS